jgi:NAD(P)-dependent dehydrogenase (short-subunit alcohol dehydrogenase family)
LFITLFKAGYCRINHVVIVHGDLTWKPFKRRSRDVPEIGSGRTWQNRLDTDIVLDERLFENTGRTIEAVVADLNDKVDLARVEHLLRIDATISLLVNNAGVGVPPSLLDATIEKVDRMIALNVTALVRLTYAVIPGFLSRGVAPSSTSRRHWASRLSRGMVPQVQQECRHSGKSSYAHVHSEVLAVGYC